MTVGFLADQYFVQTGVGTSTRNLFRALCAVAPEHRFAVLYPGSLPPGVLSALPANVELRTLPDRRWLYPFWHTTGTPSLDRWAGDLDLIHAPVGSVRVPTSRPLVATIHDLASERSPSEHPWRRRVFKAGLLARLGHPGITAVAISDATRQDLVELYGLNASDIPVVHHGVDRKQFCPQSEDAVAAVRNRYGLPELYLLFVGGVGPRKNIPVLLDGYERLCERLGLAAPPLVMAGPARTWPSQTEAVRDRLLAAGRLLLPGFVDDDDVAALYGGARALVYPSRYEGFGLPVLEAMACGTPVVCARATSLPEVAGDAAILVDPDDPDELADALATVICDAAVHRSMIEAGLERAAQFSWTDAARKLLAVYESAGRGSQ